jgi:hypothetical protein
MRGSAVITTTESSTTMKYAVEVSPTTQRMARLVAGLPVISHPFVAAGSSAGSASGTNGRTPDGQAGEKTRTLSVSGRAIRLQANTPVHAQEGDLLRYALLAYSNIEVHDRTADAERRRINAGIAEVLARPNVTGWLRLQNIESATTLRHEQGGTLLTDGPFVDSKDFLGGFIVVEADNLDGALAVAEELQELRGAGAIEIRPVREEELLGA